MREVPSTVNGGSEVPAVQAGIHLGLGRGDTEGRERCLSLTIRTSPAPELKQRV